MTRIIIDDVESIQDLYAALAAVTQAFTNPEKFESEEEYFSKHPVEGCDCEDCRHRREARGTAPVAAIAAPMPYVPCPDRGTHLRLTDCWACWCDVHRGACLETDVLAPEAWDLAIGELVAGQAQPQDHAVVIEGEVVEDDEAGR